MKLSIITFALYLCSTLSMHAQTKRDIADDDLCDIPSHLLRIQPVESFKDSVTLTINLNEIYVGKKTKSVKFVHTELITSESSIIEINKEMAIRVSIARVIDNGNKCYLYKIHLFEKYKDCWYDRDASGGWNLGKLGVVNSGFYHGTKGEDCFGYEGDIILD